VFGPNWMFNGINQDVVYTLFKCKERPWPEVQHAGLNVLKQNKLGCSDPDWFSFGLLSLHDNYYEELCRENYRNEKYS
jgi:hypothetical protein